RHFSGSQGLVTHCGNHDLGETSPATVADSRDPDDLERWTAFHEGVANLPTKEREVVGLIFYHGWTQLEVAEFLRINERTVRRWWESALLKIRGTIGEPES